MPTAPLLQKLAQPLTALYEVSEGQRIVELLLEDCFGYKKHQIPSQLDAEQLIQWQTIQARLLRGEPMQHISNRADFYGYAFYVDKTTLIPRPETEELVEWVLDTNSKNTLRRVLDIGTGSGCIPITLHKKRPDWSVAACDISTAALHIAQKNSDAHRTKINFFDLDILDKTSWAAANFAQFDIIISNPPYILASEAVDMHPNVRDYEPPTALFVPDTQALVFYEAITELAVRYLQPQGQLFFEIHYQKGQAVLDLLQKTNGFTAIELRKDLFGNDRMVRAVRL